MTQVSRTVSFRVVSGTSHLQSVLSTVSAGEAGLLTVPSLGAAVSRLDPSYSNPDYPDRAAASPAWIWAARACWDPVKRRAVGVFSPHNQLDNGYANLLTSFDETGNNVTIYEDPFGSRNVGWPRTIAHAYDGQCIRGRVLYRLTFPTFDGGTRVQPQICMINLDALTNARSSGQEGAAYLGQIATPSNSLSGAALEYVPACDALALTVGRNLWFYSFATSTWSALIQLPFSGMTDPSDGVVKYPYHNICNHNPLSGRLLVGGGANYTSGVTGYVYSLQFVSVDCSAATIPTISQVTLLDDAPVIFSVNETALPATLPAHLQQTKAAACASPTTVEHLFLHDNLTDYAVDPTRPSGSQWRTMGTRAFEVDFVCSVPDRSSVLCFTGGAGGTAQVRAYKPTLYESAGNPLFFDDFDYALDRVQASGTKSGILLGQGYTAYKDENSSAGANGYIYTATSVAGYGGVLPGSGPRALVLESNGGTEGQTDYYLQLGNGATVTDPAQASIPPDVWFQFWYYLDPARNTPSGKWLYALPAASGTRTGYPGSVTEMPWLLTLGTRTFEPSGNAVDSPFAGAHIFTCEIYRGDRTDWPNDNQWKLGPNLVSGNAKWMSRGVWYLHKMRFDSSGTNGRWEWWQREMGTLTWTKMAEYIGGTTANFTWVTQASERYGFRNLRIPTTNSYDSTQYVRDFCIATSEVALPTYGSY